MRKSLIPLSLLTSLPLVSCSTILDHLPGVYTVAVQQGNIIEQSMVDQLRPNMNKRQVLYIMGSPMLNDVFHTNRWEYLYSDKPSGEDRVQKQLTLVFENDQIVAIQGDFRPSVVPVAKPSVDVTVEVPKRDLEKTLWEKITGLVGYDDFDTIPRLETKKTAENNLPL
ncbi:MAG: outer membrane protein assembly factor BamE [Methylococcales bacterium]|nr:outer membrane protein assembly factor BamE [Methylococcales bacterium]